ncbi:Formiminotetrahydrofolate cyclodeaminase [Ruminococcaceae bacterium YRB3002]|nr:Formiminotetrahydrofolate cyclodeaminase [Ruminococcaceae bacterium YRB3002]
MDKDIDVFIEKLASNSPTPGGGGASSLVGAVGTALLAMVANLTTGKKKYVQYQEDIDVILVRTKEIAGRLLELIDEDAEAFEPLAKAYGIPKDNPGRDLMLEDALKTASSAPFKILETLEEAADIVVELGTKGSKLAISDVGCAATMISAAAKGAVMNIYINTKLMQDRGYADDLNERSIRIVRNITARCDDVYDVIAESLGGTPA